VVEIILGDSGRDREYRRPAAELVEVAFAGYLGEAEMIQGLLEGAGISSLLRPAGVDGATIGAGRGA
jgi:hypothetical protein